MRIQQHPATSLFLNVIGCLPPGRDEMGSLHWIDFRFFFDPSSDHPSGPSPRPPQKDSIFQLKMILQPTVNITSDRIRLEWQMNVDHIEKTKKCDDLRGCQARPRRCKMDSRWCLKIVDFRGLKPGCSCKPGHGSIVYNQQPRFGIARLLHLCSSHLQLFIIA